MRGRGDGKEAGFSLIETIAAMGVLSLAAVPLLQLVTNSVRNNAMLESRFLARTVAENVLVQNITKPASISENIALEAGFSEQLGKRFTWALTIAAAAETEPQFVTVEVRQEGRDQVMARLSGLRLPQLQFETQDDVSPIEAALADNDAADGEEP